MPRALTLIFRQWKRQLNHAKLKVSAIECEINYNKSLPDLSIVTQLKISILKDESMPDGGAMENGALLSASELEKHSFFINSPSDDVPVPSNQTKNNDGKDKTYQPPKCSNALDDEAPEQIFGSDGEELTSETEYGCKLVRFFISAPVILSHHKYL